MRSDRAKFCPICKRPLISTGQLVKTIKAQFVRSYKTCEPCGVRVVLVELPAVIRASSRRSRSS